jgi:hypothetical protein
MQRHFTAPLWQWQAKDGWYFVTLPTDLADEIADGITDGITGLDRTSRGFGAVRVRVTVGGSTWETSLFPDRTLSSYVLPVKKAVRTAESLTEGSEVDVHLDVL